MTVESILNHAALKALVDEAVTPARWPSKGALASACGFSPATLSNAAAGRRDLSPDSIERLVSTTGWSLGALYVPVVARPGDLESRRLLTALERLRTSVVSELDQLHRDITARNGG